MLIHPSYLSTTSLEPFNRRIYFSKKILQNNWENPLCPLVVLMSATLDVERFSRYFSDSSNQLPEVIYVMGKTYEVSENFLKNSTDDFKTEIINTVKYLRKSFHQELYKFMLIL